MKFIILLLTILIAIPCEARGLRRILCEDMGEVVESVGSVFGREECEEGNYTEYIGLTCGLRSTSGITYNHDLGDNVEYYRRQASSQTLHNLTDQSVLQGTALNIREFNQCQFSFYNHYFENQQQRDELKLQAKTTYEAVFEEIRTRRQEIRSRIRSNHRRSTMSLTNNAIAIAENRRREEEQELENDPEIEALISSIPLGNRPQMKEYIIEKADAGSSPDEFMTGFDDKVMELKEESLSSLRNISARIQSRTDNGGFVFRTDDGFRNQLISSGLVENYIVQNNMQDFAQSGYLCRIKREQDGCIAVTAMEVLGSVLVPYAAASLALRAGLTAARAVGATARARAMAIGSRALIAGSYAIEGAALYEDIRTSCWTEDYLASKESTECNPEKQYYEVRAEADIAGCVAAGLIGGTFLTSTALNGARRLRARVNGEPPPSSLDEVADEDNVILVTADVPRRRNSVRTDNAEIRSPANDNFSGVRDDELSELVDSVIRHETRNGGEVIVSRYSDRTREAIQRRLRSLPESVARDAMNFVNNISDVQKRRRYLGILLNSGEEAPSALARLRRLEAGENPQTLVREIDNQVESITEQIRRGEGAGMSQDDLLALARRRSQLMQERFLISHGDDIEIDGIYSANAHNEATIREGNLAHSLEDSFGMDIKVKPGRRLSLCRGSYGTAGGMSAVTGSFFTLCRDSGYISRGRLTDVVAAPTDVQADFPGYERFNRFDFNEGDSFTMGLNGAVTYGNGSGGRGGGIEFFTSRTWQSVSQENLQASVRIPVCGGTDPRCSSILETQADIRQGDLQTLARENGNSAVRARLQHAQGEADELTTASLSEVDLSSILRNNPNAEEGIREILVENPTLTSALGLRREIELKQTLDFSSGDRILDSETRALLTYNDQARGARDWVRETSNLPASPSASELESGIRRYFSQNPTLVNEYKRRTEAISEAYRNLRSAEGAQNQLRYLQEISNLRDQQSDLMVAIQSAGSAFSRHVSSSLGREGSSVTRTTIASLLE